MLLTNNTEQLILWFDGETTGGALDDPWANVNDVEPHILEIGAILTDYTLTPVGPEFHALINPGPDFIYSRMPDVVCQMHVESGLIHDLDATDYLYDIRYVDETLRAWIDANCSDYDLNVKELEKPSSVRLAGSGVSHYDSRWIKRFLPITWVAIEGFDNETKPTLDIGVIRRFLKMVGLPHLVAPDFSSDHSLTPHRALDDVKNFIAQAQWYRDTFAENSEYAELYRKVLEAQTKVTKPKPDDMNPFGFYPQ